MMVAENFNYTMHFPRKVKFIGNFKLIKLLTVQYPGYHTFLIILMYKFKTRTRMFFDILQYTKNIVSTQDFSFPMQFPLLSMYLTETRF